MIKKLIIPLALPTVFRSSFDDLIPRTQESHDYMWSIKGTALELTQNYGTENPSFEDYHAGKQETNSFDHVAFDTDDV